MQQKETQETPYHFSEAALLPYPYLKKITLRHRVASFFRRVGKWWDKAKRFLLQHNVWRGGNLLILLVTLSVLAFTLAFSVGSILTVGILPVWGLTLLLGGALLVLWNIGALYQARRLKRISTYLLLDCDEPFLEENKEENESKSWGQFEPVSFSLLSTPPKHRSPATSDEEISGDERGQNALQNSIYPASEDDALLIRTYLEDERKPYDLSISFFQEIPQQNSPSTTSDEETSYEETPDDDTCQNTFQVR